MTGMCLDMEFFLDMHSHIICMHSHVIVMQFFYGNARKRKFFLRKRMDTQFFFTDTHGYKKKFTDTQDMQNENLRIRTS